MRDGYLCLVRCRGNSLYTGISTDVERRFWARRAKAGAKYPKGRGSLGLICPEKIGDKRLAHRAAHVARRGPKVKKERLVHAGRGCFELIARQRLGSARRR